MSGRPAARARREKETGPTWRERARHRRRERAAVGPSSGLTLPRSEPTADGHGPAGSSLFHIAVRLPF